MAGKGPQRKPTALALLSGSTRAKARAKTEPGVGFSIPPAPEWMRPEVAVWWPWVVSQVEHLRCVTDSDATQMVYLADAMCDWHAAQEDIVARGVSIMNDKGGYSNNPSVAIKQAALQRVKDALDRLGLNPSNRSRVIELATKLGEVVAMPEKKKSRYE